MSENKTGYHRTVLFESDFFEVTDISWTDQHLSQEHGHGWSECSVLVCEGVFENTLKLGLKKETQVFEKGQVIHTPKGAKHSLRCTTKTGRTLHVYTPKIKDLSEQGQNFKSELNNQLNGQLNNQFTAALKLNSPTRLDHLKNLLGEIQQNSISTHSPYFMNQLFSGVSPQMLLASDIVNQSKTTLATQEASPVFSAIESEVVQSLCRLIGWQNSSSEGVVVPGGSAANFMSIHCARQKYFPEAKTKGVQNQLFKIYVSVDAHYSFKKGAVALGLGLDSVTSISVDAFGRMNPEELNKTIISDKKLGHFPLLIAATAGTTVFGAFDQLDELSKISKKHDLWLHVDGAWGGPVLFSSDAKHLVNGIEKADSMTFDAHKLFGAAMTSSFFLTNHKEILLAANDVSGADYLFHNTDDALDRGRYSWQCGRGADAFSFWTIWKSVGTEGLGLFIDNLLHMRKDVETWVKNQPRLQILGNPVYLNLCVRLAPPPNQSHERVTWANTVREKLKADHKAFVNFSTDVDGTFLRFILAHPDVKAQHLIQTLEWALDIQ